MKLHRDLGIAQSNAWHMTHRIREAWNEFVGRLYGPVEVDETYIGGLERNKHANKKLHVGGGPGGKALVIGMKDRRTLRVSGMVADRADSITLQKFVRDRVDPDAEIYTDNHRGYIGLDNHESVNHSIGQYVKGEVHTNGIEGFWAIFKRAHKGTYHKMSWKHLHRYVNEFAGRYNVRNRDTIKQMRALALAMVGKRLQYKDLIK